MKTYALEIMMIFLLISILSFAFYKSFTEDRPIRCFEGHKYRVDSNGVLNPMITKFGPMKCDN